MTAGANADDLLAAGGCGIDDRRLLDVVDDALSGLVVAAEAPRVCLAVLGHGEAVAETGLHGDYVVCLY